MKSKNSYIVFSVMGMELLGLILVALFLGRAIDQQMEWDNYALIGCSILALIFWFYHFMILLKMVEKRNAK